MEQAELDIESRIIEAAKDVFVRKGFVQTTMTDIAGEAGIGRTALHYYYRTKEMLFEAICGQLMSSLLPNINAIMDGEGTMIQKIPLILDEYVKILLKNQHFPVFIISELNRDHEHFYRVILKNPDTTRPIIKLRTQLLDEMENGIIKKMPLPDVIMTAISMLVFPLLIQRPITDILLEGDNQKYQEFIAGRGRLAAKVVLELITPDQQNHK